MKERLDVLLVKKGFCDSREKAKRLVMAGLVYVDGQRGEKPGAMVEEEGAIFVKGQDCPYVSRGGLKLEKALDWFEIDLKGLVCADMGASTGGFTDCCLQRGAEKVYAMDVGYGQLDWRLRKDPRVVNMEKVNIRYLDTERFDKPVDFVSIDVSFISLTLILPVAWRLLKEGGRLVCLVKPQFEAGREQVGKKGIVKDPAVHRQVMEKVACFARQLGFTLGGATYSPMTGAKGNIEYLLYFEKNPQKENISKIDFEQTASRVIMEAHEKLMK